MGKIIILARIPHIPLGSLPPDVDSGFACERKEKSFCWFVVIKQLEVANPVLSSPQPDYI